MTATRRPTRYRSYPVSRSEIAAIVRGVERMKQEFKAAEREGCTVFFGQSAHSKQAKPDVWTDGDEFTRPLPC